MGGGQWEEDPARQDSAFYDISVLPYTNDSGMKTAFQGSTGTLTLRPEGIHPFQWGIAGSALLM